MPDPSQKIGAEVVVPGAVLAGRAVNRTVVKDGLQLIDGRREER